MNSNLQNLAANSHVPAQTTDHLRRMTGGELTSPAVVPEVVPLKPSATMCVAITAGGKKAANRQHGKAFVAD